MKLEMNTVADNTKNQPGSTAIDIVSNTEDLELNSQVRSEIAKILELSVAQINSAIDKSDPKIDALANVFSDIADQSEAITVKVQSSQGQAAILEGNSLLVESTELKELVNTAVMALQFYDRLSQRINHVSENLKMLATLVENKEAINSPGAWKILKESMWQKYSDETEKNSLTKLLIIK